MNRFDDKGMIVIPNPKADEQIEKEVVVVESLFCPKGHSLISSRAIFDDHPGILVKARQGKEQGQLAISPVYGEKALVTLDMDVDKSRPVTLYCPHCETELPVHSSCTCGSDLIAMFLNKNSDFGECIGICNRLDCFHSHLISNGELVSLALGDSI